MMRSNLLYRKTKSILKYTIEKGNVLNFERAKEWIKENNFDYIYIHLDVDVMSPEPNNPENV